MNLRTHCMISTSTSTPGTRNQSHHASGSIFQAWVDDTEGKESSRVSHQVFLPVRWRWPNKIGCRLGLKFHSVKKSCPIKFFTRYNLGVFSAEGSFFRRGTDLGNLHVSLKNGSLVGNLFHANRADYEPPLSTTLHNALKFGGGHPIDCYVLRADCMPRVHVATLNHEDYDLKFRTKLERAKSAGLYNLRRAWEPGVRSIINAGSNSDGYWRVCLFFHFLFSVLNSFLSFSLLSIFSASTCWRAAGAGYQRIRDDSRQG